MPHRWARTAGYQTVHILMPNRGVTLCRRRLMRPEIIRDLEPDKLVRPSSNDCFRCIAVFNELLVARDKAAEPTEGKP